MQKFQGAVWLRSPHIKFVDVGEHSGFPDGLVVRQHELMYSDVYHRMVRNTFEI